MSNQKNLLAEVCDFSNLHSAFVSCSRGKKRSKDYQKCFFGIGEKLKRMQAKLASNTYKWGGYTEFFIHDPKKRLVMCAPFLDRVVHHAICQVIEPTLDPLMPSCVYACRKGKGNMAAIRALKSAIEVSGKNRFVMKMDVEKYFASIDHCLLLGKLSAALKDDSLWPLLRTLLASHPEFCSHKKGIPIGNLSSQLFANFYLVSADEIGLSELGGSGYFRYMDDMILLGEEKRLVSLAAKAICSHVEDELALKIPFNKQMPIGRDPVPFLGYVIDESGYKILSRTKRRFAKNVKRQIAKGASTSLIAQMETSFESWANLGYGNTQV